MYFSCWGLYLLIFNTSKREYKIIRSYRYLDRTQTEPLIHGLTLFFLIFSLLRLLSNEHFQKAQNFSNIITFGETTFFISILFQVIYTHNFSYNNICYTNADQMNTSCNSKIELYLFSSLNKYHDPCTFKFTSKIRTITYTTYVVFN